MTLAPLPNSLVGPSGALAGLWAGSLTREATDPVPGRGRIRRWSYAAAATPDGRLQVGAAVVTLGPVATTFAWLLHDDGGEPRVRTWERRLPGWRVGVPAQQAARATSGRDRVVISPHGGLLLALDDVDGVPIHVDLVAEPGTAAVCSTPTPGGGWNTTEKQAGHAMVGSVAVGDELLAFDGHGWRDWTCGRQDRHTTWRWAAAAGRTADGRSIGLNASVGMNGAGPGEDVVWLAGRPAPLEVKRLEAVDDVDGRWVVEGPGWGLEFTPLGVRAARERLVVVRSAYVQPIGTFAGTLPDDTGGTVEVACLPGVTEDHEALW